MIVESGNYPDTNMEDLIADTTPVIIDPRLNKPLPTWNQETIIAPSYHSEPVNNISMGNEQEDSRIRGIFIHRCLQILTEHGREDNSDKKLLKRVSSELGINHQEKKSADSLNEDSKNDPKEWIKEARTVINHPEFSHLFNTDQYLLAYNEAPVQYMPAMKETEQMVYGIIDRVIITESEVFVIDYKTHRMTTPEQITKLEESYRSQVSLYCQGASQLWPNKTIRGFLLLTHKPLLVPI
jgi:ATP-dependent helicase/nuclease subunit A